MSIEYFGGPDLAPKTFERVNENKTFFLFRLGPLKIIYKMIVCGQFRFFYI